MTAPISLVPKPHIEAALRQASRATGTDFKYLLDTAVRESGLKPTAKSKTSSATGLFQFIDQTWLATMKKAGQMFNAPQVSNAIKRTESGRHIVPDAKLRQEILALRKDPKVAALMAGVYTRESADTLTAKLGRSPKSGELYMAHFLGAKGAGQLIAAAENTPGKSAVDMFPRAARANKAIFYNRNGSERSVAAVYRNLMARHGGSTVATAAAGPRTINITPAGHAAARANFLEKSAVSQQTAESRPLHQSLFLTAFEGDRMLDKALRQAGVAMSPAMINALAGPANGDSGDASNSEAARERRGKRQQTGRIGLLAGTRATGSGKLTHSLFRTG